MASRSTSMAAWRGIRGEVMRSVDRAWSRPPVKMASCRPGRPGDTRPVATLPTGECVADLAGAQADGPRCPPAERGCRPGESSAGQLEHLADPHCVAERIADAEV